MLSLVRYVKAPLELVSRFPSFRAVGFADFPSLQWAIHPAQSAASPAISGLPRNQRSLPRNQRSMSLCGLIDASQVARQR